MEDFNEFRFLGNRGFLKKLLEEAGAPRLLPWALAGDLGPAGSTHWASAAGKASCSQRSQAGVIVTKCQGAPAAFWATSVHSKAQGLLFSS